MLDEEFLPGSLFVIAAPSGAGKTSLVKALQQKYPDIEVSISCTTRAPRLGEESGVDYHFVDDEKFAQMIAAEELLEHAEVYGKNYGTPKEWLLEKLRAGVDIILEIDWQGARQIRQSFPAAVLIFILPPSLAVLEGRLRARKSDSAETVKHRMGEVTCELSHFREFDYLVVNDDFDAALDDLLSIVRSRHLLLPQQIRRQHKLLHELLEDLDKKG